MQRKPSVHITEDRLKIILKNLLSEQLSSKEIETLADHILKCAKNYSLSHRHITISNAQLLKKAERMSLSSKSDASKFAEYLTLIRRKMKHRGIQQLKVGDSEWITLKEITSLATEFCNEFGLELKVGYQEYIKTGLSMMKNYSLSKFKNLHSAIVRRYEAVDELQADLNPESTEQIYKIYNGVLHERTGMDFENYRNNPEKYVAFKRAKDSADKMGIPYKIYITAQFEMLEWANRIPDPLQLYGDKAIERVVKYCSERNIKITKEKRINWKTIRKSEADDDNN